MSQQSQEVEEFLKGPLVTWLISCLKHPNFVVSYNDLVDGVLLHDVFLQICPEPFYNDIPSSNGEWPFRIKNLECILENVKQFYEETLGQLLVKLPDVIGLGKEPEAHVGDMKLLILLILGCAVQCKKKESFVFDIKSLDVPVQIKIVDLIKRITDDHSIVINQDTLVNANAYDLYIQIKAITQERNLYCERLKKLELKEFEFLNVSSVISKSDYLDKSKLNCTSHFENEEDHACSEVSNLKSKVRKLRQELEEKSESLMECKGEVEDNALLIAKLYEENEKLLLEVRTAKSYRDELDAAVERAEKVDRLEKEISRYRGKLNDMEYYKTTIEELREDTKVLEETKETLEEELQSLRKVNAKFSELEQQVSEYKQIVNKMTLERTEDREKYQQLREENIHLQFLMKSKREVSKLDVDAEEQKITSPSLSDQLTNSAQKQARRLELENRRLSSVIRCLKENSLQNSPQSSLESDKGKRELESRCESLTRSNDKLVQRNSHLEHSYKAVKKENEQLQASLKKQQEELEDQITLESQHDQLSKDYENRLHERDILQNKVKEGSNELKVLKESYERLKLHNNTLKNERDIRETELNNYHNLKREHLKLKEDFKYICGKTRAMEQISENSEERKKELINLKKRLSQALEQLVIKEDLCVKLDYQIKNLSQRCEELLDLNNIAHHDKKKLMEYTESLTLQNKDFFEQAMEEKENNHSERREFTNTIYQLNMQIRKLEDKIMEYYKNAPSSNSGLKGKNNKTNFVQKVKKVGSDLLNRSRRASNTWEDNIKPSEEKEEIIIADGSMTLDPRLLRGKRGLRDHFSLGGNLGKRKLNLFYEDNVISRAPSLDIKIHSSEHDLNDPDFKEKIHHLNKSTFDIDESNDEYSSLDKSEEHIISKNKANYLGRSHSKNSLWVEYGCT